MSCSTSSSHDSIFISLFDGVDSIPNKRIYKSTSKQITNKWVYNMYLQRVLHQICHDVKLTEVVSILTVNTNTWTLLIDTRLDTSNYLIASKCIC